MKSFSCLYISFFLLFSSKAQVTIDSSGNKLTISAFNAIRMVNGVGEGRISTTMKNGVVLTELVSAKENGILFDNIPGLTKGVAIWRYKPWNSWTKPMPVTDATKLEKWDVQFFYWQYGDGLYGAVVPLSGNGFRTTLGSEGNKWGSKADSYVKNKVNGTVPCMAIAFGKDPYELFARIYSVALEKMGKSKNEIAKKALPLPLQYIGWCTWNSSNMGRDLGEEHIVEGVKTFTDKKFPLGWVLVDDGWFQHQHSQLQSLEPDPKKFPQGFKPLINKLKTSYGIKYVGIWQAFNGYWNGIDPSSTLGKEYQQQLFSWRQWERVDVDSSATAQYYFIKPEADNIYHFYDRWHQYFRNEGFDFIKVDNQLVAERMAVDNYPLFDLSYKMHDALYRSINKNFKGAVINCMDMTADAYLNFGTSATARTVEDYFPYEPGEAYNLQRGNAAAHILQAIYNSIYFSQMVYTDYDMFESSNPNAVLHALARTLNNGPIYLTDKPGQQNFEILNRIVFSDGRSIRSQTSLLPSSDCLFQIQDKKIFKAFSRVGSTGLLALFNLADADKVSGSYKASDVEGLQGNEFALYDYFSGEMKLAERNQTFDISLSRMGYQLEYVVPVKNGFAAFGLVNKYNGPATIISEKHIGISTSIQLYEGGQFKAYAKKRPVKISINGKEQTFIYKNNILEINVAATLKKPEIRITW